MKFGRLTPNRQADSQIKFTNLNDSRSGVVTADTPRCTISVPQPKKNNHHNPTPIDSNQRIVVSQKDVLINPEK